MLFRKVRETDTNSGQLALISHDLSDDTWVQIRKIFKSHIISALLPRFKRDNFLLKNKRIGPNNCRNSEEKLVGGEFFFSNKRNEFHFFSDPSFFLRKMNINK